MKKMLFILLFACVCCACDETLVEVKFPVTLYAGEVLKPSAVRVFTKDGEIFDTKIIHDFVRNDAAFFDVPDTIPYVEKSEIQICFQGKDSVTFGNSRSKFDVRKNGNQFLFYSDSWFMDNIYALNEFLKYKSERLPMPPTIGSGYVIQDIRVGYGSYSDLELAYMASKLSWNLCGLRSTTKARCFNEFNEDAVDFLQAGDTLAILEYRVRFRAR